MTREQALARLARAVKRREQAIQDVRAELLQAREAGATQRELASVLGVKYQAVQQILAKEGK